MIATYVFQNSISGTRYKFSDQPNTFFLYSEYEIYNPADGKTLAPGTCVKITSIIHNQQDVPYMDVDELISGKNFNNFLFSYDAADCQ